MRNTRSPSGHKRQRVLDTIKSVPEGLTLGEIIQKLNAEKQAKEGHVTLKVSFSGTNDAYGNASDNAEERIYGPSGTGRR